MSAAAPAAVSNGPFFDVDAIRRDFPILSRTVHGKPLVYLDNAASAQKPQAVIDAETQSYADVYANVHRGAHFLSGAATDAFEAARVRIARFINAAEDAEIIFTRGATEAINLVAQSWGRAFLAEGDEIIVSELEHHANIVPWQMLRAEKGVVLKVAPIHDDGSLDLDAFEALVGPRTRLIAISGMSNALGTILPIQRVIAAAKAVGARTLIDACQLVVHTPVDVQALDCDFLVFSAHKLYGPSGVGALYAKRDLLEAMPPWQGGGEMIATVTFEETIWADVPHKFEAGTPAIAQAPAFAAAIDYVETLGMDAISAHETAVGRMAEDRLRAIPGLRLFGGADERGAVLSFAVDGAHPHDVAVLIDRQGVAVRSGHHCAQPLMARLGLVGTARASFALYNTADEVEALGVAVEKAIRMLG